MALGQAVSAGRVRALGQMTLLSRAARFSSPIGLSFEPPGSRPHAAGQWVSGFSPPSLTRSRRWASGSASAGASASAAPAPVGPGEQPEAEATPKRSPRELLSDLTKTSRRLAQFVVPAKSHILKGLVCLPFGLVSSIALPYVAGRFVDQLSQIVANAGDLSAVYPTMGLVGLIAVVGTIGSGMRSYYFNMAGEIIARHIRLRLFSSLLKKRTPFFDRHKTGDLMSRLAADTNIVSSVLTESVSMAIRSMGILVIGSGVLIYTSPKLALATIGVIVPFALMARMYGRFIKTYTLKQLRKQGDAASVAEEVLNNIKTVGVFSREPFEAQRYATEIQESFVYGRKIAQRRGIFMGSVNMVMACTVMGVLGVGAVDSIQPQPTISAGQYATFLMLSGHVGGAVHSLSTVYSSLMRAMGASERILEVLDDHEADESYALPYSAWEVMEDSALVRLDPSKPLSEFAMDSSSLVQRASEIALDQPEELQALQLEKRRLLQLQIVELMQGLNKGSQPAVEYTAEGPVYASRESYLQAILSGSGPLRDNTPVFVRQEDGSLLEVYSPGSGPAAADEAPSLHFRDLDFTYPARPQLPVFRGLDLKIPIGSVCAVLGPSGSGKSTLLSLLARFYEPNSGSVEIAGMPLNQLDLRWLRTMVSAVPQETVLFRGSIADNIRYGNLAATPEEIEAAARQANAHDFIMSFPLGYDTPAGQLSGGQRQRICCARAIIRNPPILVLDEATSALDVESEWAVQRALENLMQGRTTMVIAHRLSTIRNAQYIAILDEGRVVEFGTRDEVMSLKNGRFNEYLKRSSSFQPDAQQHNSPVA